MHMKYRLRMAHSSLGFVAEVDTADGGFGMDGLLRVRNDVVRGILNGADLKSWNPKTDKLIPVNFDEKSLENKAVCKAELQRKMGLPVRADVPVIGIITRLVDQKGIAEIFAPSYGCMYRMCSQIDLQFAVLGSGEKWCENEIRTLQSRLPNMRAYIGYNEQLSHLIEAGSDFFLMPSKYEPCGLNQMYSLLYGTLPIVRHTGGLADTVENYNENSGEGTGFMFNSLTPDAVFNTTGWAVYAYYNKKEHIRKMQERGMKKDFTWKRSAEAYVKVYQEALARGCSIN